METVEMRVWEARECFKDRRYIQALTSYTEAIEILTTMESIEQKLVAELYDERGVCYYAKVCFDKAVEDYTQALEFDPSLASAYFHRGTVYYRMIAAHPKESKEREELSNKALADFEEAVKKDPTNLEFMKAFESCKDEVQPDVSDVKVLDFEGVPLSKLVKLLFLLDNGDKETGTTLSYREANAAAALKAKETFQDLIIGESGDQRITHLLQRRAKELRNYEILNLPHHTEAASHHGVRKQEEDLLLLAQCCRSLGIKYHTSLDDKLEKVQLKMELEGNEKEGNFYVYAENLLMSSICESLTTDLVFKLFNVFIEKHGRKRGLQNYFDLLTENKLEREGVKEALFFFMIREMEECNLLNRIYTDKLHDMFEELQSKYGRDERVCKAIECLQTYPDKCQPPGLCLLFCVTEEREGAQSEITKIESVFKDLFKFTVKIEKDPTKDIINKYKKELLKTKYRFYDSLVIWFVSHGNETDLTLYKGETYNREEFIDDFSIFSTFNKKPKIFFMATCQGNQAIGYDESGSEELVRLAPATDGQFSNKGSVVVRATDSAKDISKIYYQMDRLISYATLPCNVSFRDKDEGSVFVDTVCYLLKDSQGENITQLLEIVSRQIHQVLFKDEEKFKGKITKQACFYESTLQKTFLVPNHR